MGKNTQFWPLDIKLLTIYASQSLVTSLGYLQFGIDTYERKDDFEYLN